MDYNGGWSLSFDREGYASPGNLERWTLKDGIYFPMQAFSGQIVRVDDEII